MIPVRAVVYANVALVVSKTADIFRVCRGSVVWSLSGRAALVLMLVGEG